MISGAGGEVPRMGTGGGGPSSPIDCGGNLENRLAVVLLCPGFNLNHIFLTRLLISSMTCYFTFLTLENCIPVKRM